MFNLLRHPHAWVRVLETKWIRLWTNFLSGLPTYLFEGFEDRKLWGMEVTCEHGMLSHLALEDGKAGAQVAMEGSMKYRMLREHCHRQLQVRYGMGCP